MLWRVRTTFVDRPGILAETATACGAADVNILSMQVFAMGERVTDVFVVSAPEGWTDLEVAELFESAGGAQVSVTRVDQGATVDSATRYMQGLREVLENGRDVADVLAELLETEPPDVADYAGHDAMEVGRRNGSALTISRAGPFTSVEKERAEAFFALTRRAIAAQAQVTALPTSTLPVVRTATLADVEAVAALHERCSDKTLFERYQIPMQLPMTARMTRRLVAPDSGVALVAQHGRDVVGHALLEPIDDTWTLRMLVQDSQAHAGLETLLVRQAARHAKASGADRLTLVSAESNDTLLRAVGNAGFMARIERRDGSVHISVPLSAVRSLGTG